MDRLGSLFTLLVAAVVLVPPARRLGPPSPVLMTLFGGVLAVLPMVKMARWC
ncbi:hypothetical protein [Streptomyces oceani]|uniref:hypothetical protein n=1 Tax=Streptomyces oceani TaxID=1075402 RepID=UPI00147D1DEB|nr:hypothetical protein [Streptomyces oceani]